MPGPGPHLMYAMASGLGLTTLTNGRFSPHHTLTYTINSFFGPDIGSFSEWLGSLLGGSADTVADLIHHPFYYILILGIPLSFIYSRISSFLLHNHLLDSSLSKVPLTKMQCFFLISAGSFTHFFLDHLFEFEPSELACIGTLWHFVSEGLQRFTTVAAVLLDLVTAEPILLQVESQYQQSALVLSGVCPPFRKHYEFDSHCVAVRKFSGVAKDERIVKEAEKLEKSLGRSQWGESKIEHGGYSIAQYKYTPFRFAKRINEVWVDIHAPELGCDGVGSAAY
ncbi:heme-binding protein [Trifolium repens]|nr:heme-binding protein [Trifolium repens]